MPGEKKNTHIYMCVCVYMCIYKKYSLIQTAENSRKSKMEEVLRNNDCTEILPAQCLILTNGQQMIRREETVV